MSSLVIIILSTYFLTLLLVGYFASRRIKTMQSYLVADRRLPFLLAVPAIVAGWFGAGSCMGVSGTVYAKGFYGVMADPFGCSLALIIAGLFFAIPFRKTGLLTISDVLSRAYGKQFERIATLLTIPFYIGTLASNMLAMGYIFQIVFGGSVEWGVLLGSTIMLAYTVTGGMWAVTLTDFMQLVLLTIGLLLIVPVCFNEVNDIHAISHNFFNEFKTLVPDSSATLNWSEYLGRILMTGLGAIMGQDLVQRLMAAKSANLARKSAVTAGFLYFALGTIPLFIGLAGREILPNLQNPEQLMPLLAQHYLSPLAFSIFACGLLAAIMSTADSYLLAGTSLVVNNILLKIYPIKTEKNKIKALKLTNIFFAVFALFLALSGPSIFDLMVHSGATLFVSIFVPVCGALFWKSTNRMAAWSALLSGLFGWIGFIVFHYSGLSEQHESILFSAATFGASISLISYLLITWSSKILKIETNYSVNT